MSSSRAELVSDIDRLTKKHEALIEELRQIEEELSSKKKKLEDLPKMISSMEQRKTVLVRLVEALRGEERLIPGSANANHQAIDEVNQLRRNAINAIHSF